MSQPFKAFTARPAAGLLQEIVVNVGVSAPFPVNLGDWISNDDSRVLQIGALWDTGATNSVITKSTARQLGLEPFGMIESYHAGGKTKAPRYAVHIFLPTGDMLMNVKVSECADATGSFGVVIGMDIITKGDFVITNVQNTTTFSFRMPSIETIDYTRSKYNQGPMTHVSPSTPRNMLCPCNSGKKYKHCHGKEEA
ncbi:SEC-C metal-binding domain-containing protein [Chitinophaga agrisoli]|uniref:SEC-C metal-binding domain-containing protein n=1 Tax=Chitinophaga agrisoli TaxID=2607653 RepID=UPI001BC9CA90|nr:SEC-C metal-binding domain-containing protein [Chitinophaga agrisoli]